MSQHAACPRPEANALANKLGCFAALSSEEQSSLHRLVEGRLRFIDARKDIIREGQSPNHVNLIVSGWACRYKLLEDGRRQILAFFLPGDLCDLRIFLLKRMDHSVGTLMPTTVAEIPREAMVEFTEGDTRIARALWWSSLVAEAIEREWIVNLGQRTALERIGHLFCEVFMRQKALGLVRGSSCDMPLTQSELAEACGLSTVHVNRSLQDLRARGLIELRSRRLVINDFDQLAGLSLFSPGYLHLDCRDEGPTSSVGASSVSAHSFPLVAPAATNVSRLRNGREA